MSAQVRERPGHDASGGHRLDRRVLVMWWTVGALLTAAVVAMTVVAVVAFDVPRAPVAAAPAAVAVAAAAVPPLRYRRWRYDVRARDALVSKGALFYVAKVVPFDRIQFVESRQGPLDRVFGLSGVVLYTAAGRAAHIPGLSAAQAERLRDELSRVAGTESV